MKSDKDILKQFKDHYQITKSGLKNQYRHIQECNAFYAGDYMNYKDNYKFGRGSSRRIKEVQFNRVKPYVNSVVGFMAQQRREPNYEAKVEDPQERNSFSEYFNGYSNYIRENANADQIETLQDKDMVIGGIGATDTAISLKSGTPTRDPNGEIIIERVNPLHVGYDPLDETPNKLDSRWVYRAKDFDIDEIIDLLDADEDDFQIAPHEDRVDDFQYNPYGGIQDKIGFEWADPQRTRARVYFYQWFEIESFYRVENPLFRTEDPEAQLRLAEAFALVESEEEDELFKFDPTSQILTITKDNKSQVKGIFDIYEIPFDPIKEKRKVFYTAVISGDKVFSKYKSVSQQGYSIKFKCGDWDDVNRMHTGIVASLRDPQRYYNKSLTELMLIIANNSRGGVIYEEDAVDNVREFEANWAKTNGAVRVNSGALSGGKIQPKAIPHLNTGYEGILQTSSAAMGQVTGIDESFFGVIAGGNTTAMLQRQQIKQATTTLALYFDSIGLYAKEQARLMLSFMRLLADANEGGLFSTKDDDGNTLFERISGDFFVDEYEISITEAPETPLQKEYYTETLFTMAQAFQTLGDQRYSQIYAAALKYMPIPAKDKSNLTKILIGQQQIDPRLVQQLQSQIQQLQGEQAQLFAAEKKADIQKTAADTQAKVAETRENLKKSELERQKLAEDVEKQAIENDIMNAKAVNDVNVTI